MSLQVYGNYTPETAYSGGISKEKSATNETKQYSSAADYAQALSQKYDCVKNGSVAISASYLSKCANDPEKASELEENLSLFKDIYQQGYESAKRNAEQHGGKLVSYSQTWSVDSEGNISAITQTTSVYENGTKSWKELNEERAERLKAKKEEAAELEKKRAKKKEQEEQRAEQLERRKEDKKVSQTYKVKVAGTDIRSLAEKMAEAISRSAESRTNALDIKA